MDFIEVNDVVKHYGNHTALNHVNMSVDEGSIYGLLGPNGAGKSTLIRIINQIICQDSGTVLMNGNVMTADDVRHIGYLPEERGLYKKMKVTDHIVYLGRLKGMSKGDAQQQARLWLERFNLTEWGNKRIEALSKGMAQKVQFIATVVHRPKLLIFDEPFSGFDPVNAEILKQEILRLRDEGATVLFSTHNMDSVEAICQNISLINHAEVVLHGNVEQIRQQYKKHIYNIEVNSGTLAPNPSLYTIEQIKPRYMGGSQVQIRLCDGVDSRTAIGSINEQYDLAGFQELLPSMNEIFIETVTGETSEGGHNNE